MDTEYDGDHVNHTSATSLLGLDEKNRCSQMFRSVERNATRMMNTHIHVHAIPNYCLKTMP